MPNTVAARATNVFSTAAAATPPSCPPNQLLQRPNEFPLVDSENTLADFSSIQQQLIKNSNSNLSADSIICVEKTTTHHNYYDVEKLAGDETTKNTSIHSSANQSTIRLSGMGNPAIIGKFILTKKV
jgi:hypothetical protein